MDQPFYAFLQFHKGAIRNKVRDLAFDSLARWETFLDLVPRILLRLLESELDAFLFLVNIENDDFELLPYFDHLAGMAETAPGHVGDVK